MFMLFKHKREMSKPNDRDHSYNLAHTNPRGYKTLVEPRTSLAVVLENSWLAMTTLLGRLHLDFAIPALLVVLLAAAYSWRSYREFKSQHDTQTAEEHNVIPFFFTTDAIAPWGLAVTIVTGFAAAHNSKHLRRTESASKYISEFRSETMSKHIQQLHDLFEQEFYNKHPTHFDETLFNRCHTIPAKLKGNADGIQVLSNTQSQIMKRILRDRELERSVIPVLAFFEHMGQDVKMKVVDREYLKDYFYRTVVTYYEFLRKYIEFKQYKRSCRVAWCNFVYLAKSWEEDLYLPKLPPLCRRPLVLTSADLE